MASDEGTNEPPWQRFQETVLEFHFDGLLAIDLRAELDTGQRELLETLGLESAFAVVTPCNPGGRAVSATENHRRCEVFETQLAAGPAHFVRADGRSPDGSHSERGAAIAMPLPEAIALARAWQQAALFWYEGGAFWLIATSDQAEPLRLPGKADGKRKQPH